MFGSSTRHYEGITPQKGVFELKVFSFWEEHGSATPPGKSQCGASGLVATVALTSGPLWRKCCCVQRERKLPASGSTADADWSPIPNKSWLTRLSSAAVWTRCHCRAAEVWQTHCDVMCCNSSLKKNECNKGFILSYCILFLCTDALLNRARWTRR